MVVVMVVLLLLLLRGRILVVCRHGEQLGAVLVLLREGARAGKGQQEEKQRRGGGRRKDASSSPPPRFQFRMSTSIEQEALAFRPLPPPPLLLLPSEASSVPALLIRLELSFLDATKPREKKSRASGLSLFLQCKSERKKNFEKKKNERKDDE